VFVLALAAARKQTRIIHPAGGDAREITEPSLASRAAFANFTQIVRPFTDMSHFITYMRKPKLRGWGNGMMKGVARWYNEMPVEKLAQQVIKYQTRDGVSQRDAYDLCHPARWQQPDPVRRAVFNFIVDGRLPEGSLAEHPALRPLIGFGKIRSEGVTSADAARLIQEYGLPIEAVPNELKGFEVYDSILQGVLRGESGNTLTWLVRNLGNLAKHDVLSQSRPDTVAEICGVLQNEEALKKARIHPVSLMKALLTYSQGHGDKGKGEWNVISRVVDSLDAGFYKAFHYVAPSNKRVMLAVDVSGSMWQSRMGEGFSKLSTHQAAGVMALAVANSEPNWSAVKFDRSRSTRALNISPRQRLDDVVRAIGNEKGNATDLADPMRYARENRIPVDAFVLFTDYETWSGSRHGHEELYAYRRDMKIPAKVVNVAMTPNSYSMSPPGDPGFLEVTGFDAILPQVISSFLAEKN
jgi:60 kDa SS-A/Ro ribonucleoprotein